MSDLATLLGAIASLVTALGGASAGIILALRTSRKERPAAAEQAAELLLDAAADGEISPDELAQLRKQLRKGAP